MQVRACRANGRTRLLVEYPWRDVPVLLADQHPVVAALDKIKAWDADLKSGRVRSFTALAKREGITTARVSQLMRLTRLSSASVALLRQKLVAWNGSKEAFSLRKLQQLSLLPEPDQMAEIESLGRRRIRSWGK